METPSRPALVERLSDYDRLLEVGVGRRTDVAAALAREGHEVVAVDVAEYPVPEAVTFRRADVRDLSGRDVAADAVYALNLPRELHRPAASLAGELGVPLLFTTLGFDEPAVAAERETLPGGTLYEVAPSAGDS